MRAILIINPVSGGAEPNTAKVAHIQKALADAPFTLEVAFTDLENTAGLIARQAVESGCEVVLVGGGDGTVSEVARELIHTETTLGVLPIGTFNNFARSLELPTDLEKACRVVAGNHSRQVDVGLANNSTPFLEAAGAGLDAALFPLGEEIKGGHWARLPHAFQLAAQYRAPRFRVTLDCTVAEAIPSERRRDYPSRVLSSHTIERRSLFVVAANGPYYGSGFTVAPAARMNDGKLTLSIFRNFGKWELLHHFISIARGRRQYSPKIETFIASEIHVESSRPAHVHVDGIASGNTPVSVKSMPGALRVFVPLPVGHPAESS